MSLASTDPRRPTLVSIYRWHRKWNRLSRYVAIKCVAWYLLRRLGVMPGR